MKIQKITNTRVDYAMEDPTKPEETEWFEKRSYVSSYEEYDENGNVARTLSYNYSGDIHEYYQYVYDDRNNLIEEINYYDENEIAEHRFFSYDESDRRIEERVIYQEGGENIIKFFYDENGNLVKRLQTDVDGEVEESEIFEYENGLLACAIMYDEEDNEISRREYEYNENAKITSFSYQATDAAENYETKNFYNDKGQREKTLKYNSNGQLIEKNIFTIDEHDNVAEIVEEDARSMKKTCFTYDEKNRIIKEEVFGRDDELLMSVERTYNDEGRITESLVFTQDPNEDIRNMYATKVEYSYYSE